MKWFSRSRRGGDDILVVCTGNVCRSPYIAAMLTAWLPDLVISSAGTGALVAEDVDPQVLRALAERDVRPAANAAQQVTRQMIRDSRLIITATTFQRGLILDMVPNASVFTLKELARITDIDFPVKGLQPVIERAAVMARKLETVDFDDDLGDPHGLDWSDYARMAIEVDAALAFVVPALIPDEASLRPSV